MESPRSFHYLLIGLRGFFYALIFSTFAVWFVSMYFGTSRPKSPMSAEGRIYPYYFHGTIVYVTKFESFIVHFDIWILLICATMGVGFAAKWLDTLERRRKRPS
jgi:hypothetical protein